MNSRKPPPLRLALAAALIALPGAAAAFDCRKAATPIEKAICADPNALQSDAAMSAAYARLTAGAAPSQRPVIAAAQARWLKARDSACAEAKGAALGACLAEQNRERRRYLSAEPEAGPGAPGRLAPWFRIEKGAEGRADIDVQLLKFPAPQAAAERAFDKAMDTFAADLTEPEKGDPAAGRFAHGRSVRLVYASPRLISALVEGYDDTGGAHPGSFTASVNIDVAAGRVLRFADLVDAQAAEKAFALCLKSVVAQKKEKGAPLGPADLKDLTKQVREATADLAAWSFAADRATVTYDAYAVGSYAEGPYSCELPYATLRPLVKAGFPLP